ncbi:MAG: diguanylate cyclase [Myxococcales bacterium]|nr:diguanylate cyclase [Myxococcales bacterium]
MNDRGGRVLIVEDDPDDARILQRLLGRLDRPYHCEVVQTCAQALARLQSGSWDVVFVDHRLPDCHGEELIPQIRDLDPGLPVAMLTGQGDETLAVAVMKAGAWDYLRKGDLNGPLLEQTLRSLRQRVRLEAEVRAAQHELEELAVRDGLTGLCNHRHFQALLQVEFARARRYGSPLACLMLDLDHFKGVNDTWGHPCGDEVLRSLAALLRDGAREVDVLARYGGEEFVLLMPNTDAEGARRAGERICRAVAATPIETSVGSLQMTVSVGAATDEMGGVLTAADLVQRADEALYRAKRSGRNGVRVAGISDGPASQPEGFRQGPLACLALVSARLERLHVGQGGHGEATAEAVAGIAPAVGLTGTGLQIARTTAHLLGLMRLATPDRVLHTEDVLSADDRQILDEGPALAETLVRGAGEDEALAVALRFVRTRYDGVGSTAAQVGAGIPLASRVVAVADAWCALTSPRPWRPAFSRADALAILSAQAGRVFDPAVVEALGQWVEGKS